MGAYEDTISVLEAELAAVERAFAGLSDDQWRLPTKLVPVDPDLPHWTVFELAGHFDIAIGLTRMLIAGAGESQPARDRASFFINPRSETAPVVYGYAYKMVEGKTPADMPGVLHETFSKTVAEARAVPAGTVGPGYFAPMRADEFVASRRPCREADVRPMVRRSPGRQPALMILRPSSAASLSIAEASGGAC